MKSVPGSLNIFTNAAESAGVRIILEGEMPEKPETQELIVAAGAEALTNAVRHAGVRELRMIIKENRDSYLIDFLNDCGDAANSSPMTVSEGGGSFVSPSQGRIGRRYHVCEERRRIHSEYNIAERKERGPQ